MDKHIFLVALGTDELPSKSLKQIGQDFCNHIQHEFKKKNILYDTINWFAAPRHLAIKSKIVSTIIKNKYSSIHNNICYHKQTTINIHTQQQSNTKNIPINNYIKLHDFTKKQNDDKQHVIHNELHHTFIQIISNALKKLINHNTMKWSDIKTPFIRPVNTITVLLDSHLIPGCIFNINIDRIIYGHKYTKNNQIILNHANDYPYILIKQGSIIVDFHMRKKKIKSAIQNQASKLGGILLNIDENFLEEITSLTEWPVILFGNFDKKFLKLPIELIIHIMQYKQKYFPVYDSKKNKLLPYFIFVVNTITKDYSSIIMGHENVIKAHFINAEFFLKHDNQYRLQDYIPKLDSIIFHRKLGSIRKKSERISKLSNWIANQIHENTIQAKRAGYLCKCDLMTSIVSEFPEMQGIIGMYYATRDGEPIEIARAQKEHYQPKYAQDKSPTKPISCIVSIADKIDTISGIFGIRELPTGSRDPFGLKRSADGILNILIQNKIHLNLFNLIHHSIKLYEPRFKKLTDIKHDIYKFIYKRLFLYYSNLGFDPKVIKSVSHIKCDNIIKFDTHIHTIHNFYKTQTNNQNTILNTVYKRISNILKKQKNFSYNQEIFIKKIFINNPIEMNLLNQIINTKKKLKLLLKNNKCDEALKMIIDLSNETNIFLDNTLIMHPDPNIQRTRLTLLNTINNLILKLADVSAFKS